MNENDARQFFDEWEQCSPRELKEVIDQAIRDRGGNRLSPLKLRLLMKSIWEEIIEDVRFEFEMKISDSLEDDYEEGRRTTEPTDDEIEGLAYPKVSEALRELTKVDLLRRVECQLWNGNLDEILSKSDDEIVAEEKADKDARTALQALPEEEYSKIIQEMAEQAKSKFNMELKVGEPIYVYVLRHPDGTPIYEGKGTGERANSHIDRARQSTD